MYSNVKYHLPKPKLSGQSFIDVYKRGEGAPVLSGLSNNCNPETIALAEEMVKVLLDPKHGNNSINFYKPERRKFEGRIILKYAAKKLMEQNRIDVLILARVADGNIDLCKFQMQLAQKLGILECKDNDADDSDYLDDVLARRIHASLEKQKFLFVCERYLYRETLQRVGLPSDVRIGYFSKVVFVTESQVDLVLNVLLKDTNATWDLACAQVEEYSHSQWSTTSGEGNKPIRDTLFQFFDTKNIIQCLANFPWYYYVPVWKLCWFVDIFCVLECPYLNVNTRLKLVDALLYDLYELGLAFHEKFIPGYDQRWFHSDFDKIPKSSFKDFEKIFIDYSDSKESWQHLITTPKFPKLSTLVIISSPNFPEDFFKKTEKLRVLFIPKSTLNLEHFLLRKCKQLSLLPSSVLLLPKLQLLNLNSCTKLSNVTPSFRQVSKSLIELDISNCTSLENFKEVSSSVGDTLPNLEVLHCSKVKLDKLFSIKGCPNLNTLTLGGNKNVEVLDISGTQLNKFYIEKSLPDLKCINVEGTKCLCAVDWEHIIGMNWDEFGAAPKDKNRGGVYIAVSSDIVFETLQSRIWRKHFSQFHICLFPSKERGKEKRMFVSRGRTHYNDIYMRTKSPSFPYYDRFLECAGGVNRFPKYISNVLSYTEFLSLYDDRSIKRLSDFRVEILAELKECWIEKCYSMETIFDLRPSDLAIPEPILGRDIQWKHLQPIQRQSSRSARLRRANQWKHLQPSDLDEPGPILECLEKLTDLAPILGCLEKLRISEVIKATHMCIIPGSLKRGSFGCLKYMHLEYCPRLLNVFTSGLCLENLEEVEIKFCARLQEVFSGKGYNVEGSFSKLHTLCFIELPVLTSIIEDVVYMPSLTKIKVKGCPKLGMLPLGYLTSNHASSSKHPVPLNVTSVVVSGEPGIDCNGLTRM